MENTESSIRSRRSKTASIKILKNAPVTRRKTKNSIKQFSDKYGKRWQIIMFEGPKKQEGWGIIDMLAIRKNTKFDDKEKSIWKGDLIDIIIIDIKGSESKAKEQKDIPRLVAVKEYHRATNIVHAEYQKNSEGEFELQFYELDPSWKEHLNKPWIKKEIEEIFK